MVKEIVDMLKDYGVEISLFTAGALGAAMLSSKDDKLTKKQRGLAIFFGGITAVYVTPLVLDLMNSIFELTISEKVMPGAGYIIGYLGLESLKWGFKLWGNYKKEK